MCHSRGSGKPEYASPLAVERPAWPSIRPASGLLLAQEGHNRRRKDTTGAERRLGLFTLTLSTAGGRPASGFLLTQE